MENARRNQQLLSGTRAVDRSTDFEFDAAVNEHYQFVGAVHKILPALARRVGPQATTETSLRPFPFHMFLIHRVNVS
jgi:hypothetical protein